MRESCLNIPEHGAVCGNKKIEAHTRERAEAWVLTQGVSRVQHRESIVIRTTEHINQHANAFDLLIREMQTDCNINSKALKALLNKPTPFSEKRQTAMR